LKITSMLVGYGCVSFTASFRLPAASFQLFSPEAANLGGAGKKRMAGS
jgi:hypothetical protein